jgi:hypothetical protein
MSLEIHLLKAGLMTTWRWTYGALALTALLTITSCQSGNPELNGAEDVAQNESGSSAEEASSGGGFALELGDPLGIEGVSPELIAHPDGGFVLFSTGLGQDRVFTSSDGQSFAPDRSIQVPMGSDYSLLQKPDGTWLLYYVTFDGPPAPPGEPMDPKTMKKVVMVSQSSTLGNFGPGTPTGIRQEQPGPAWGVPETYIAPDGTYMMMWVDMPEGERWEVLRTATSPDGITFTANEGFIISDGYVDPFMLRAEEGDWVLLLSTTPSEQRLPQKIFVARSVDGTTWDIDDTPLLESADYNYLDPAAVELGENEWLVVLSQADKPNAISGPHNYVRAILRETPAN